MIAKTKKHTGSGHLIRYLLKPTKKAQIIDSSIYSPSVNKAINTEKVIEDGDFKNLLAQDINSAFKTINALNPRCVKNTAHFILGFDPHDGAISNEFKAEVARRFMDYMGFNDTYWVAVAHDRDDLEHDHIHNHDHVHIVASRVNSRGRTISDSWSYPKAAQAIRQIEQEFSLEPFIPFWERPIGINDMYWMINAHEEEEEISEELFNLQPKNNSRTLSR
jgi:Relaxase/Mobilisation nuclease domain